ncbi:UNVERIFIED_CONTAM: hypothetical protein FKN15_007113 [Acipenser sinensis]
MRKKSRQRQRQKQQQQQLPPQVEDPASLFPLCSWCGREDHRWRSCPDGPPADWCGRCEADGHSWAGCPHNPDQEQLQTPFSAATPPLPTSPPSQEIWDWLMHPEADLFHDLPIAINTLWRRDGGRTPHAQAPRSRSPSPQAIRVKRSNKARDIMDLKAQMAQVLELLSKQSPAAPQRRSQDDTLSIAASWDRASFSSGMEVTASHPQKLMEEVRSSWDHQASARSVLKQAAQLASLEGTQKLGLVGFPQLDSTIAALANALPVGGLARDPVCPN